MAQKPLSESLLEIQEIDKANNVVATYVKSPAGEKGERIDIVVSYLYISRSFWNYRVIIEVINE